jgi:isopentenyl diphosphate isomerase/L-lactate dehydrogenase-like FMN-dependent dehydrogenase
MAESRGPEPPRFVTVDDYEPAARALLPRDAYDYFAGGAGDERTLADNLSAFDRWLIRPRFLRGSGAPDTSTTVLGTTVSFPVLVAPWAYQRMAHPDGEPATARAAARAGTVMCVSTTTVSYLEEVAAAADGPKWWQLYVFSDRDVTAETLKRVAAAGFGAIVWTVDFPVAGLRHRDTRNGFMMPIGLPADDLVYDPDLTWDDLAWIRSQAQGLPVLVKGLLTGEDAQLALDAGADGIVVSNHGGRQLDASPAGLDALPEIAEAVAGRVPVLMDGGVRRGTDVLTALALGATAVMVGRPAAWGLSVAGEEGVADVLRILRDEFANAMALAGCGVVAEITRAHVTPRP